MNAKLLQIQRLALLSVAKTYRTASYEAINVLTGIIPLDISVKYNQKLFNSIQKHLNIELLNETILYNDIEHKDRIFIQPWLDTTINWQFAEHSFDTSLLRLFTDGSKINEKVGCAFIVVNVQNDTILHSHKIKLKDSNSVFQAELLALYKAVEHIILELKTSSSVYSDSRSALQALGSNKGNHLVRRIQDMVHKSNLKIRFYWIKAHAGHRFNELADAAAKEATDCDNFQGDLGSPITHVKNVIFKNKILDWQDRWDCSERARGLFALLPMVSTKRCISDFYINQVLTGHGVFPAFQAKMFYKSPECSCGAALGSVHHVIYDCYLFADIRREHFPSNYSRINLLDLARGPRSRIGICRIIQKMMNASL